MKILYLNVNGFFGNSNIKEIQKKIKILRANQKNGCYPNCSKKIANELKEEKEEFDFIFLVL